MLSECCQKKTALSPIERTVKKILIKSDNQDYLTIYSKYFSNLCSPASLSSKNAFAISA